MRLPIMLAASAALLNAGYANAADFETPPDEPPSASLPAEQVSGANFHIVDPVRIDGLMHHYVVDGRFGSFPAYGRAALAIRLREVAALTQVAKTSDVDVIAKAVGRRVETDVKTVADLARNPVRTVVGIPKGIAHLFGGYAAQAKELSGKARKHDASTSTGNAGDKAAADARRYADRYFGVSAAERRWFEQLGVDPYTDNEVLRKAVHHLAKVEATTNIGLRFAVPGLPYVGDVRRAMDAIYHEDPAVLRARRRDTLKSYGLDATEIDRFENLLLLSPTRQRLLEEAAKSLDGVDGRAELFRHAMTVTSVEEIQVFLQSTALLARLHSRRPVARILAGLRVPTAQLADGQILVFGAFDAVYWTEDVAGYEQALREALPADAKGREVWLSGQVSPRARTELTARGWDVHDDPSAAADPPAS